MSSCPHFAQGVHGDQGVDLRRGHRGVSEQLLHHPDVGAAFEQVGGERVAQHVRRDTRGDAGALGRVDQVTTYVLLSRLAEHRIDYVVPAVGALLGTSAADRYARFDAAMAAWADNESIVRGLLGALAAYTGGARISVGAVRVTFWGALAMALTAAVGSLFGTTV